MNKNTLIIGLVIIVAAVGGYLLVTQKAAKPMLPEATPVEQVRNKKATDSTQQIPVTGVSDETVVTIENFSFNPGTVTIKKGTKVTWTNKDSVKHDVSSDTGSELKSQLLAQGESYSHVFNTVGTYVYHCNPHAAKMKATIVVGE